MEKTVPYSWFWSGEIQGGASGSVRKQRDHMENKTLLHGF